MSWLVCQIGAREHYVIAAELNRRGLLDKLLTDIWAPPGSLWRAAALTATAVGANRGGSALAGRFRADLPATSPNVALWANWARHREKFFRDKLFDQWAAERIRQTKLTPTDPGMRRIVFAYSYAAYEIGLAAKEIGATFVLGQIDGGPKEQELVRSISEKRGLVPEADWRGGEYWARWRQECELADLIVANSQWSKELLRSSGIPISKCTEIPLAFESNKTAAPKSYPLAFSARRPLRVLFLGQVIVRKGILELLQCFEDLADYPIELRVVGPAPVRLEPLLSRYPNVSWKGSCPRAAVHQHYEWADIFIIPTHADGFAITQIEAMSFGLPILASRNCGRVVEHTVNGFLLNDVSPDEIRRWLVWVSENPANLEAMSQAAVAAIQKFSASTVIAQLCDAVQDCIA